MARIKISFGSAAKVLDIDQRSNLTNCPLSKRHRASALKSYIAWTKKCLNISPIGLQNQILAAEENHYLFR